MNPSTYEKFSTESAVQDFTGLYRVYPAKEIQNSVLQATEKSIMQATQDLVTKATEDSLYRPLRIHVCRIQDSGVPM